MEVTPLCWILLFFISRVAAGQSPGSLIVRPNRSQFFEYESVSLSCEVLGGSAGWKVMRNSADPPECGGVWGRLDGTNCLMATVKPADSGEYWCQSGVSSNAVNITVTDGHVILESPALPVTEGHSVTLNCRYKKTPSNLTADFYKDGYLIRTETTGEMTIPAVNMSDEGLYSCRHPELRRSPESWMTVTAPSPSTTSPPPSSTSSPLLISLSGVAGLFISLIILLLLFCYRKKTKEEVTSEPREVTSEPREEMYADVRIKQKQEHRRRRDKSSGVDPVYSAAKTSTNTGGATAGSRDVTYGQIDIRTKKKKKEKLLPPEPDVVYSSVRPASGPSKGGRVV